MKTSLLNRLNAQEPAPRRKQVFPRKPTLVLSVGLFIAVTAIALRCAAPPDHVPVCTPEQSAAPVPPPSPNEWLFTGDAFEGTFLQLWQEHTVWTRQRWETEFAQLRRAGMKLVVVQWVQHDELDFTKPGSDLTSPFDRVVAAADTIGIDLCIGLALRKSWWQTECFRTPYIQEELERNRQLASRLYPLLQGHRSFYGWYIPHEVTDIGMESGGATEVRSFFKELTASLNDIDPLKPVLASGYTDRDCARLVHFVTWWTMFLQDAGIDVLVFQDGAGLARKAPWTDIEPWIDALRSVVNEVGGDLWLVGEIFSQTHGQPIDDRGFQAESADFGRVRQQIDLLGKSKKRLLAYSYFDYMRPSVNPAAAKLFDEYMRFTESRAETRQSSAVTGRPPVTAGNTP